MEEFKIFVDMLEKHGLIGVLTGLVLFDKFKLLWRKYISKKFVSYNIIEELKSDVIGFKTELYRIGKVIEKKSQDGMEKERHMEVIQTKLQRTENRIDELGYIVRDISGSLKTNNRIIGEVKDFLERLGEKK